MIQLIFGLFWVAAVMPALAQPAPPEIETVGEEPSVEEPAVDVEAERAALARERAEFAAERAAWRQEQLRLQEGAETASQGSALIVSASEHVPEVVAFGQNVDIYGSVDGDVVSFGGDVRIASRGQVGGNAVSFGGQVRVDEGGRLEGDRVTLDLPTGSDFLVAEPGSERFLGYFDPGDLSQGWEQVQWRLVLLLSVAGAGMLVVGLFPNRIARIAQDLEVQPLRAVGLGILGALVSTLVVGFSVLFAVLTLFLGVPVSAVLLCGLGFTWLLGFVGLCQALGDRLPISSTRFQGRWLAFLLGIGLVALFAAIPWIGGIVVALVSFVGVGAAISTRLGSVNAVPLD